MTTLQVYQVFEVPEVWMYRDGLLALYRLTAEKMYVSGQESGIFPALVDTVEWISGLVQAAIEGGMNKILRQLCADIASHGDG
ncbi:MAG: hypothetical protein AAFY30_08030 [Cyanobacteria bacterium J06642_12]